MAWEEGDLHGRHVAAASRTSVSIEWGQEGFRTQRTRVRDHTCNCRSVFYELCQAGGQRYIRRTTRKGGRVVVEESVRMNASQMDALWSLLLQGDAR